MELPDWIPERLASHKESIESSPHRERFEALLTSEDMASVWPELERRAKNPENAPGQKNPLDMYLFACVADQWKSSGHANSDLKQQAETHAEAAKHLRRYTETIEALNAGKHGKGAYFSSLLLSARALGVDTRHLDGLSEPEFIPLLGKKLQDLVSFHETYSQAIQDLASEVFRKSGSGIDARILAVRRTLTRCTSRYFQGPCWKQVASTVNVIARQLDLPEDCTEEKLKNAKR